MEKPGPNRRTVGMLGIALLLVNFTAVLVAAQTQTFAVIGDTGSEGKDQLAIAAQMNNYRKTKTQFDFVLLLGDNIYPDGVGDGLIKEFEVPFKALLDEGVKFYAVLGNHDIWEEHGAKAQINYPKFNMGGRRFYLSKWVMDWSSSSRLIHLH